MWWRCSPCMGWSREMPSSSWSRNLHHLLVERREKHLSRDWLLEVAAQVENVSKQLTNLFFFFSRWRELLFTATRGRHCTWTLMCWWPARTSASWGTLVTLCWWPKVGLLLTPRLSCWAPLDIRRQSCCLESLLYSLWCLKPRILLWQLDSREVPCAGQHPQIYLSFFLAFMCELLVKLNVTLSGLHVSSTLWSLVVSASAPPSSLLRKLSFWRSCLWQIYSGMSWFLSQGRGGGSVPESLCAGLKGHQMLSLDILSSLIFSGAE